MWYRSIVPHAQHSLRVPKLVTKQIGTIRLTSLESSPGFVRVIIQVKSDYIYRRILKHVHTATSKPYSTLGEFGTTT